MSQRINGPMPAPSGNCRAAFLLVAAASAALAGCPGPSSEDAAFKRSLEQRFGKPFVCETSAHSGYCCQVDKTGSFVPGYESYCTH